MKRIIFSVFALSATATATAQSSVTLCGIVDNGERSLQARSGLGRVTTVDATRFLDIIDLGARMCELRKRGQVEMVPLTRADVWRDSRRWQLCVAPLGVLGWSGPNAIIRPVERFLIELRAQGNLR